jgi:hypothetical protein
MRRNITMALLLTIGFLVIGHAAPTSPSPSMVTAARAFLDSLTPEQKARAQLPFDADERFSWFYTPVPRKGLTLKDMRAPQRRAAMNLLRAGLSEKGYAKAETIRALEDVLVEMGGNPRQRDKELYYFSIFGEPGPKSTWGWRYEGHHLSHHWTVVNGTALASTPQFFGANPADVKQGTKAGTRALGAEEDIGFALLRSLTDAQRQVAIVDHNAPNDILTTNAREATAPSRRGLAHPMMTTAQRAILAELIEEHASAQADPVARERVAAAVAEADAVSFAWMGGTEKGQGHYYRVQGRGFLIEFDNTQNGANHIHAVWRDFSGDWGRGLLAEHYRAAHR